MSDIDKVNPARRKFLRTTLAAGAGAAVAGVAADALAAETIPDAQAKAEAQQGYHETQHIRDYYRTAAL